MNKVIDKLSAYNIFTNLFPGVIYCFLADKFFDTPLIQDDLVVAVFLYYFCGMVISRISSVVVEPLLKRTCFVRFVDYKKYVAALVKDEQISVLLETSNAYRSIVALLLCVLATGGWVTTVSKFPNIGAYAHYIILVFLLILFLFAYRKQTQYIVARVELHKDKNEAST
ncbi:hypothetical protein FACS1894185_5920 [Betaproteobacteria bacterium]|nr:hypothetical protein FACS1894185_5920 [Betaproteobacteria bacterium]